MSSKASLDQLKDDITDECANAQTLDDLEKIRVISLGKKGRVTGLLKQLGTMPADQRKDFGQSINQLKETVELLIKNRKTELSNQENLQRLTNEKQDPSLPVSSNEMGLLHPISQTIDEIIAIFAEMDFALVEGPDIEDDFHNFTALNIPPEHPARQMFDTFYIKGGEEKNSLIHKVLRTHTSPVQIRTMENNPPPIRVICPGRTYRSDSDMTHTPMFHQVEGLVIGHDIDMGHLKGCLRDFIKAYFEIDDVPLRFRPSYFPFTEPSAEMDIACSRKDGGLKIGSGDDWLEILGCGMVHPNVLKACGYNPDEVQGFAFGMGIERIAMLKYGIPDLRTFFDSDLRWLKHYGFVPLEAPSLARGLV